MFSNSPYRLVFYLLIPYFVLLILYMLYSTSKKSTEHFETTPTVHKNIGVSTQPSPQQTKLVNPPIDTRNADMDSAKKAIDKRGKPQSKFLSPLDENYKKNLAEQDRIKKQIKEIDEKRKKNAGSVKKPASSNLN